MRHQNLESENGKLMNNTIYVGDWFRQRKKYHFYLSWLTRLFARKYDDQNGRYEQSLSNPQRLSRFTHTLFQTPAI